VSESNINRQVQATGNTLGQHKGLALQARIADIHPGCEVQVVDAFVDDQNWPGLLTAPVQVLVDACDQVRAKAALAVWARQTGVDIVSVGAAGGKRSAQAVEVADLADVTHDPLLASLRQRLRKSGASPSRGRLGVRCVFSREGVAMPQEVCEPGAAEDVIGSAGTDGSLNCHGYGSSVAVTATFGMVAAGEALTLLAGG
jgi:tRNA A37 threonylcarbamoyladenosine dehydratase